MRIFVAKLKINQSKTNSLVASLAQKSTEKNVKQKKKKKIRKTSGSNERERMKIRKENSRWGILLSVH